MNKKGVIFDFNGTLLWDTHLHNLAWDIFLKEHNIVLTDEEKHRKIHGRLNSEIMADLFDKKLSKEDIDRYTLDKEHVYQELCIKQDNFSLAEGTVELFDTLKEKGIPFIIATASDLINVEFYIRTLRLDKWFTIEHIIYNDGTMRGKPFPDLFLKALKVLGIEGRDAIIFEDSVAGVKAAEAAEAGKIIIVNSNDNDYKGWEGKYPIITSFSEVDLGWFE